VDPTNPESGLLQKAGDTLRRVDALKVPLDGCMTVVEYREAGYPELPVDQIVGRSKRGEPTAIRLFNADLPVWREGAVG
jgi:hypothetical protein